MLTSVSCGSGRCRLAGAIVHVSTMLRGVMRAVSRASLAQQTRHATVPVLRRVGSLTPPMVVPRCQYHVSLLAKPCVGSHGSSIIGNGLGALVVAQGRPAGASGTAAAAAARGIHGGKSHSATKKRFRKTGSGKLKFVGAGRRHLAQPMNSKRRRRVKASRFLEGKDAKKRLAILHN